MKFGEGLAAQIAVNKTVHRSVKKTVKVAMESWNGPCRHN
jgi:hypothetical protein